MEFHEKLQELRKQKGLTQEELAQVLFVSRTAVSKWESGRGYPNIDSLKALAACFSVSVDQLLSGDQVLTIAEEEKKQTGRSYRDLIFGLLDLSVAMFLFLPFFGQTTGETVSAVSLLSLSGIASYLNAAYFAAVAVITVWGILTLALQNCHWAVWEKGKTNLSFLLSGLGGLLFIISSQPYAAACLFLFLLIKVFLVLKSK